MHISYIGDSKIVPIKLTQMTACMFSMSVYPVLHI